MNSKSKTKQKLILASGSAYRKQVLESMNLDFETIVSKID
ncbi:MAG: Maf family protein [Spirochaetaceae bacterium]|nr:Maf family protein [Spirochaetaceae bacterium]